MQTSFGGAVLSDGDGGFAPALHRTTSTTSASTLLAQRLAPPEPPVLRTPRVVQLFGYAALLTILPAMFWIMSPLFGDGSSAWGWVTVAWIALVAVASVPAFRVRRQASEQHQRAVARWDVLFDRWAEAAYCPSCDKVTNATRSRAVPASDIQRLLLAA